MKDDKSQLDVMFNKSGDIFIPNISVDCIILSFHSGCIKILLCKPKTGGKWMLPGRFVCENEDPEESAYRVLTEKTGLKNHIYLKQFCFFGKKDRIRNGEHAILLKRMKYDCESRNEQPTPNRFISLGYYSLIKYSEVNISDPEHEETSWFDINKVPELYADHEEIIYTAISSIRKQIGFIPIGYELLPEKFTMPELRSIYEVLLGRELDRRNFQRKMLTIGYISPLNEKRKAGAHKAPNLYTFIKDKYKDAEELGIQIMSNNL